MPRFKSIFQQINIIYFVLVLNALRIFKTKHLLDFAQQLHFGLFDYFFIFARKVALYEIQM